MSSQCLQAYGEAGWEMPRSQSSDPVKLLRFDDDLDRIVPQSHALRSAIAIAGCLSR
ncbi:MAG: hypothetical protein WBB29_06935 [Geitlerinemataceae cyanobacterium]